MAAVPDELLRLSDELEAMGGGDARVGESTVFCRIRPAAHGDEPVVSVGNAGTHILVRDPRCPASVPTQQAVRRFRISEGGAISGDAEDSDMQASLHTVLGREVYNWWAAGFNATVVAHGEAGSGKTYSLFGPGGELEREYERHGLCSRLLDDFFAQKASSGPRGSPLTLGISAWEVRHTGAVDLLAQSQSTAASSDFINVSASTREEAEGILHLARSRSASWADGAALPNRSSFFVRLLLHNERKSFASVLHIVDLVGASPSDKAFVGGAGDYERRCLSQHLLCFHRLVSEISQLEGAASQRKLLSARDSKQLTLLPLQKHHQPPLGAVCLAVSLLKPSLLTQILAPMLAGSSRLFLLACVRPGGAHFLETCNTLRVASRALTIRTACMRALNVSRDDMQLVDADSVLPPPRSQPAPEPLSPLSNLRPAQRSCGQPRGNDDEPSPRLRATYASLRAQARPAAAANGASPLVSPLASPLARGEEGAEGAEGIGGVGATAARQQVSPGSVAESTRRLSAESANGSIGSTLAELRACEAELQRTRRTLLARRARAAGDTNSPLLSDNGDGASDISAAPPRRSAEETTSCACRDDQHEHRGAKSARLSGDSVPRDVAARGGRGGCGAGDGEPAGEGEGREGGGGREGSELLSQEIHAMIAQLGGDGDARQPAAEQWVRAELEKRVADQMRIIGGGSGRSSVSPRSSASPPQLVGAQREQQEVSPRPSLDAAAAAVGPVSSMLHEVRRCSETHAAASPPRPRGACATDAAGGGGGASDGGEPGDAPVGRYAREASAPRPRSVGDRKGADLARAQSGASPNGPSSAEARSERADDAISVAVAALDGGSNYDTVLRLLKQADEARRREQRRADEVARAAEEASTTLELQIHDLKIENLELRKRMRRVQSETVYADVFDLYEAQIDQLQADAERRRAEISDLESAVRDLTLQIELEGSSPRADRRRGSAGGDEGEGERSSLQMGSPAGTRAVLESKASRVRSWKRALSSSEREATGLRAELAEAQRKHRQSDLNRKTAEEATRKLHKLSRDHEKQSRALRDLQLTQSELTAQVGALREDKASLESETTLLRERNASLEAELSVAQQAHTQLQYERRKESLLLKMPRLSTEVPQPRRVKFGSGGAASTIELLQALESEMHSFGGRNPRVDTCLQKVVRAVSALEADLQTAAAREEQLMQMLIALQPEEPETRPSTANGADRTSRRTR